MSLDNQLVDSNEVSSSPTDVKSVELQDDVQENSRDIDTATSTQTLESPTNNDVKDQLQSQHRNVNGSGNENVIETGTKENDENKGDVSETVAKTNGTAIEDLNQEDQQQNESSEADSSASKIINPDASTNAITNEPVETPTVVIGDNNDESTQAATAHNHHRQPSSTSLTSTARVENYQIFKKVFEQILTGKEAKKDELLKKSIEIALKSLETANERSPHVIFKALKACCEHSSVDLKLKAVDLFAKLFDYSQFDDNSEKTTLTNNSVAVIATCFEGEGTDPELELQVVRALMHSILLMPCHGAALLQAVRQIYNIFIFSLTARNQAVAQGTLTQVISAIFSRVQDLTVKRTKNESSLDLKLGSALQTNLNGNGTTKEEQKQEREQEQEQEQEKLTLTNLENINNTSEIDYDQIAPDDNDADVAVKDAFLIFRAMCKLSIKSLDSSTIDMKSHSVRSKLLSLHTIHTILKDHIDVFLSHDVVIRSGSANEKVRLVDAVRQYINLALSKNAASVLAPVFELSLEIFWIIISNLRSEFKREIPVFWDEIYFPVAEMKSSSPHQKRYLLSIIERLCNDSRCIIEFYLNYDCDSNMPNICESLIDYLTKLSLLKVDVTQLQKQAFIENRRKGISVYDVGKISNLTSSTMSSKPPEPEIYELFPVEHALKMTALSSLVAFLRSMYSWAQRGIINGTSKLPAMDSNNASFLSLSRDRSDSNNTSANISRNQSFINSGTDAENTAINEIEQFESQKQRKKALLEGIKQFNQKAKKGINYFITHGFIRNDSPSEIAKFLLETEGLDKAVIGEYLGEGDEKNIAIMHAFVDQMEFDNSAFVDAMRRFLQAFRLPGEAQKIDRFLLKFAERYVMGNPGLFANADTAYILGYSVIMLNTDLHSPQVKNRMSFESFVMNNSGIDDGKDLPKELLESIYKEILNNEIKLQSEQHAALLAGDITIASNSAQPLGFFGSRNLAREAYIYASKEMSTKAEKLTKQLGSRSGVDASDIKFHAASSVLHVKSIFDTLWMSILAGLTPPFKEYDEDYVAKACLEGIKLSIRIACMFDLEYARASFIGALVQFQNLNNYEEMKRKSVDAIYIMLELAVTEGNNLGNAWTQILTSISQVERLQLIAQGVDRDTIPDLTTTKLVTRSSVESLRTSTSFFSSFSSQTPAQFASSKFHNQHLSSEVAKLLLKTDLEVAVDKVFTNSASLLGRSITEFVKALSTVAKEEIDSSGDSSNPRTYSLQKFVDICYYNMDRIRLEWSQLWAIMGETFNVLGCHPNKSILFFALDSLRQLSMRFLEIEELSHFKFQKEFLRPFEYAMTHNRSAEVKDLVLECVNNMILARAGQIKSGWKTIFNVCTAAARETRESLVTKSYKMAIWINKEYIEEVHKQDSFADLVICFTTLAKNEKFQRISLLSLDVLSRLIYEIAQLSFFNITKTNTKGDIEDVKDSESTKSLENGENGENGENDENDENDESAELTFRAQQLRKLWFPVLFAFHDIIMTGEELEVRSKALSSLFDLLMKYGKFFDQNFWNTIFHELLFPIFDVLRNHWELNLEVLNDKLSVWLSTTLIQALKSMVDLFTFYFDDLNHLLGEYLELVTSCICQENDTIARIGRECLTILLLDNSKRFKEKNWDEVTIALGKLFDLTTAVELFELDPLRNNIEDGSEGQGNWSEADNEERDEAGEEDHDGIGNASILLGHDKTKSSRPSIRKSKSSIVVKSVLQLLMIQTLSELLEKDEFYDSIPCDQLMKLAGLLLLSYKFAKDFNDNYDLRVRLWNSGIIERLPNLLKQESSAAAVYINIMFRMYCDDDKTSQEYKNSIMEQLTPLCTLITNRYCEFDESNQQKNISTWKPVISEIFEGYVELDDDDFKKHGPELYKLVVRLLTKSMSEEMKGAIRSFLSRVGEEFVYGA